MKYEYPFSSKYIPNWGVKDAMREFVSNAIDGQVEHGAEMKVRYDATRRVARITNVGIKLSHAALLVGGSSKTGDRRLIGTHHEGLKMALLVCAREHLPVRIANGTDELWVPQLEYSPKWGDKILTLDVRPAKRQTNNFEVEVGGLDLETWQEVEALFLRFRPAARKIETGAGEVLLDEALAGKVFVKGVYVTMEDLREGYNFFDVELDRDRNVPPRWQMNTAIARIWSEHVARSPENVRRVYDALDRDQPEAVAFEYVSDDAVCGALVREFHARHGDDAIPVVSHDEAEVAKHYGARGAVVGRRLATKLHARLTSLDELRMAHRHDVLRRYSPDELEPGERANVNAALAAIAACGVANVDGRCAVVDFRDAKLRGLHAGENIMVARRVTPDFGKLLAVLIHEYAHDLGADGTKDHLDCVETLTARVFNHLRAKD